ncbi:hypothetical protein [Falsihalocynthiibacter arcticus]|uniref:Uncharacterized protein n=1 Tax=Falsihalocynthiibacter arcticus TaxID=1579316 RepID=A0A126V0Z2_9RHOB|nr:hypothetical protein [Falsihalocynthiibacter arcticus]AML51954.1 hypothetical protein RC74_12355 [Falsihalocynthiibacter arcticus]
MARVGSFKDLLPSVDGAAPEVLCLQEVVHSPASDKDWLTYLQADPLGLVDGVKNAMTMHKSHWHTQSAQKSMSEDLTDAIKVVFNLLVATGLHKSIWH